MRAARIEWRQTLAEQRHKLLVEPLACPSYIASQTYEQQVALQHFHGAAVAFRTVPHSTARLRALGGLMERSSHSCWLLPSVLHETMCSAYQPL